MNQNTFVAPCVASESGADSERHRQCLVSEFCATCSLLRLFANVPWKCHVLVRNAGYTTSAKASWPFWRDFWGPKMLKNPNFPGLHPGPHLQRSHRPLTYGEGITVSPAKNLTPSGLVSMGLSAQHIRELATALIIDFKYRPIWVHYFPGLGERKNVLGYEGADGAMPPPPRIFGLEPPLLPIFWQLATSTDLQLDLNLLNLDVVDVSV